MLSLFKPTYELFMKENLETFSVENEISTLWKTVRVFWFATFMLTINDCCCCFYFVLLKRKMEGTIVRKWHITPEIEF